MFMVLIGICLAVLGVFYVVFPEKARKYTVRKYSRSGLKVQDDCVMNKHWYYRVGGLFLIVVGSAWAITFYNCLDETSENNRGPVQRNGIIENHRSGDNLKQESNKSNPADR